MICCNVCHSKLTLTDTVTIDDLYTLYHQQCFKPDYSFILEVDTYQNIINRYSFFRENPLPQISITLKPPLLQIEKV